MTDDRLRPGDAVTIALEALDGLVAGLRRRGRTVLGPVVRDGAVVLGELESAADLARGVVDAQEPGLYRLQPAPDGHAFAYSHGPDSFKRVLHAPELTLFRARRDERSFSLSDPPAPPSLAAFGIRACDLAALRVQDRVFLGGPFTDPAYAARREDLFLVALACTRSGGTCFCASVGTGPHPEGPFDVRLTELDGDGATRLLAEAGTPRGADLLAEVPHDAATGADRAAAENALARAAASQRRSLPVDGLAERLRANYEHPHWDDVARRCLACGNCTQVCPTCFCTTVEDATDLAGTEAVRTRRWDSCFAPDFSYIHGGSVRPSIRARYRQWLMHKLATWTEQFGVSGCVGCGRCITWCPARIDLTEEVRALRGAGHPEETRRDRDA
jgi:sulfhydrogenase subunit beta (sulfur reductase)